MALNDDDLCPFTELAKGTCGDKCCRPDLVERRQPVDTEHLSIFTSRFGGKCAPCGGPIKTGEKTGRTRSGDYVCEGCVGP